MKRFSARHARALSEVFEALEPDYRMGLWWSAMLYHAMFGVPGVRADTAAIGGSSISKRPHPSLERAHRAAAAFLSARDAGIYLAHVPLETIQGLLTGLEKEHSLTLKAAR